MSETRQVKTLAFKGLKRIIMWSSCVDSPELHATDDSRQGREETTQNRSKLAPQAGSVTLSCACFLLIGIVGGLDKSSLMWRMKPL